MIIFNVTVAISQIFYEIKVPFQTSKSIYDGKEKEDEETKQQRKNGEKKNKI